jgi:hypothetical protein
MSRLREFCAPPRNGGLSCDFRPPLWRQNLSLRMSQRRFVRLTNGFSKKLTNHHAAVSLCVGHYNLCRVHEALRTTPAVALGIAERVWAIGDLLDATLSLEPNRPVRVKRNFTVIDGGEV